MAEDEDPTISAVVILLPSGERAQTSAEGMDEMSDDVRALSVAKARFTSAGFEVHAPLGISFSIGARKSKFEEYFGQRLVVDDQSLARSVTTENGGRELELGPLPDELRGVVRSVTFVPPPDFAQPG